MVNPERDSTESHFEFCETLSRASDAVSKPTDFPRDSMGTRVRSVINMRKKERERKNMRKRNRETKRQRKAGRVGGNETAARSDGKKNKQDRRTRTERDA